MKLPATVDKFLRELLGLCEHAEKCLSCRRERALAMDLDEDEE